MDKWQCEECDNRDPCVLLMPIDYELTATVCPYSGTDCNWQRIEDAVRQCTEANVPVFVKQLEINGKVSHKPKEWPENLQRQEFPKKI